MSLRGLPLSLRSTARQGLMLATQKRLDPESVARWRQQWAAFRPNEQTRIALWLQEEARLTSQIRRQHWLLVFILVVLVGGFMGYADAHQIAYSSIWPMLGAALPVLVLIAPIRHRQRVERHLQQLLQDQQ